MTPLWLMSADYRFTVVMGERADAEREFARLQRVDKRARDHDTKTGGWGMAQGLTFIEWVRCPSAKAADKLLSENVKKDGPALAVEIPGGFALGALCLS